MNESDGRPAPGPVKRHPTTGGGIAPAVFHTWRHAITRLAVGVRGLGGRTAGLTRSWIRQWSASARYHRDPAAAWGTDGVSAEPRAAAAVGLRAFLFGLIIAGVVAARSTAGWGPVVASAGTELVWAAGRFVIIAWLSSGGTVSRHRLTTVFLAALAPYALGVTPGLRLVALAGSALLTYRGLAGAGAARHDARLATGWAFGGQACVVLGSWLARAAVAYIAVA